MGYATRQDMINRYDEEELIQLTDKTRAGMIDDSVLDLALLDADDEITPYLAARYSLPFVSVPKSIVRIACTIARYRLHDKVATERVAQDYKDAINFLKGIAGGDLDIGLSAAAAPVPTSGPASATAKPAVFDKDTLNGF